MNARKLLLLLLVLCVAVFVAACDGEEATTEAPTTTAPVTDSTEAPATDAPATDAPATDAPATDAPATEAPETEMVIITVAEALELCGAEGNITTDRYYIRATVVSIDNPTYGAMVISDGTGSIPVYGTYSIDGSVSYGEMTDKPYAGDEVLLHCILQNYNGTKEVKNARLVEFTHVEPEYDENAYTEMSIAAAREAAEGTGVKISGVVARITYAFGMVPSGVYLVDGTQCIYVYDGNLAARVSIGNTITLVGTKTYWVLDSEQANAHKFGYKGCNQLENAILLENDEKTSDFDKSWIPDSTVKELLETPVTEDITTSIVKVNALVRRVEGTGFTNYYFFDLDGETGAYTYTQCSGSDFAWLDEFDGKICTVYLSVINAKSTASECFWRLFPVAVADEGFAFDKADAPAYAVIYHGLGQFTSSYSGNPALELVTSVSSELLGFEGVTLTYASSDPSVVTFDTADGKTVMNCHATGSAEITVTATLDGVTYSESLTVTVTVNQSFDTVFVEEAIGAEVGTEVTVKGVVGASLVNQSGFYLIDESGAIAVLVDASVFDTISLGDEIILRGIRSVRHKDGHSSYGQTHISNVEILANSYGNHEYSTASFITDKTLSDVLALDVAEDHSTSVFTLKATVEVVSTPFYTNIKLTHGGSEMTLYCSGAGQYAWLQAFAGQEVTMDLAPCNWNGKNVFPGCVLAVYTEEGKVLNPFNFDK